VNDNGLLCEKYAQDVFRFAFYLTGNRADAEDIVSETFVRVWTSAAAVRTETVKGLLFTIARNLFLKQVKHKARSAKLPEAIADPAPRTDTWLEQRDQAAAVFRAMQDLPQMDRAALVMRAIDGLACREIARVLDISEVSAKVKVHRARAALMNRRRS
jgi:RNA polymerase sigma-70 factor (ECF subfamily)